MKKYLHLFLFIPLALSPIMIPIVGEWNEKPVICVDEK